MIQRVSAEVGGKTLTIETGKLAKQADGSVFVSYGDTRVLVTVCCSSEPKPGVDFLPLTVEFAEKFYSAGRIPGSFFRREGRPTTEATLSARLIDRPIRPLFPEGYHHEIQLVATILSVDLEADLDIAAAAGASAALHLSSVPFNGPTAGIRIARNKDTKEYIINPSYKQIESGETDMEVMVTGTAKAVMMVEGGAREVSEEVLLEGILKAHNEIKKIVPMIEELRKLAGKPKQEFTPKLPDATVKEQINKLASAQIKTALSTKDKLKRYEIMDKAEAEVLEKLVPESLKKEDPETAKAKTSEAKNLFELAKYNMMREMILAEGKRIDGRDTKSVRPIMTEAGLLPRTHGSSLFQRGETQVLATVTLGTDEDEQIVDTLQFKGFRKFLLHYNFPPFSVGECGRFGQSRRETGHGALVERSVKALLPKYEEFPYTIRVVCETLESNGSSSMGSVCASSMALMQAGVPFVKPIAGIAMGLIKEDSRVSVLTDILGDEDHLGDMDFKVAGTKDGVCGIQMDIKIEGVDEAIMKQALAQARDGRLHILGEMAKTIEAPSKEISMFAPRLITMQIPTDKIREVIGSGGKVIKGIIADTGAKIDIEDSGQINIFSISNEQAQKAMDIIKGIIAEPETGKTYQGKVTRLADFGAFVQILPNQEGLLHVSEIAYERVEHVEDVLKEGDEVEVKCLDYDKATGRIRLSKKALLPRPEGMPEPEERAPREGGFRGDRGGRPGGGGFRGGDRGGRGGGDRGGRSGGGGRGGDRGGRDFRN